MAPELAERVESRSPTSCAANPKARHSSMRNRRERLVDASDLADRHVRPNALRCSVRAMMASVEGVQLRYEGIKWFSRSAA